MHSDHIEVFESSPWGIILVDREGAIRYSNNAICELLGYEQDDLLNNKLTDYCLPENFDDIRNSIDKIFTDTSLNFQSEHLFRDSSGEGIWCEIAISSVRDKSGTPKYCIIQFKDITERKEAERDLERYKYIVSATDDMMAYIDSDYFFQAVNESFLQAVNKNSSQVVGHAVADVLGEEDFKKDIKFKIDKCLSGKSINFQRWIDLPGPGRRCLHTNYSPHRDNKGIITGVIVSSRNITGQKQADEALIRSEGLLRSYFNAGFVGMAIIRPDNRFLQVNDTVCDIFGYSHRQLIGMSINEITHPDEFEESERLFNSVISGEIDGYSEEKRCVRNDGSIISVSVSTECIRRMDGSVDYLVAFFQDITKRKQADIELRESESRLRYAQHIARLGFWEIDVNTDEMFISDEFYSICGINSKTFDNSRSTFVKLIHPDDYEHVSQARQAAIDDNVPFDHEYRIINPECGIRFVHSQGEVIRDEEGRAVKMVGTLHDITERKNNENAIFRSNRALRVLNECTHTIVHATNGQTMINDVCRIIVGTGGYRFTWVGYAQSDEGKTVYPVARAGYEAGYLDNDFSWNEDSKRFDPVSDVIRTGKLSVFKNLTNDDVYAALRNSALARGYRSEIALPLNVGDKAFGALMIYSSEPDAFDDEEVKLLTSLADDLAYGILSLHTRSDHERSERLLRNNENKYRLLYDENPSMFFTIDDKGIILSVNKYGAEELGYTVGELAGTSVFKLSHESFKHQAEENLQEWLARPEEVHRWEQQKICKDGKVLWVRETIRVFTDDAGKRNIFIVCEDITETRKLSEMLSYQATHDSLTGLINRGEFEDRLKKILVSSRVENSQHALCYMDLDQFKLINDTCGHVAGDELLRQLGMLLSGIIRQRDTVARYGGDEFIILMEHCPLHRAEKVARKIMKAIDEFRFFWDKNSFKISASMGLVPINSLSGNMVELLKYADRACYIAKDKDDERLHVYEEKGSGIENKHGVIRRLDEILDSLANNRFHLYFQEIKPLRDPGDETRRFEVLVRMQSDSDKLLNPDTFMPAAEHYNLSTDIDKWVIDKLFKLINGFYNKQSVIPMFFVNLSGHSIGDRELLELIINKFDYYSITPQNICFEITETVAISNLTNAIKFIRVLREKGCYFALDDFGSGLSSYSYLKNLEVDYLKLDGLFIRDMSNDPVNLAIVKSMHDIGKVLGKKTIAESVENENTCNMLKKIGLDYIQGNYVARELSFYEINQISTANVIEFSKKSS